MVTEKLHQDLGKKDALSHGSLVSHDTEQEAEIVKLSGTLLNETLNDAVMNYIHSDVVTVMCSVR